MDGDELSERNNLPRLRSLPGIAKNMMSLCLTDSQKMLLER